jgi:hypothetical protein
MRTGQDRTVSVAAIGRPGRPDDGLTFYVVKAGLRRSCARKPDRFKKWFNGTSKRGFRARYDSLRGHAAEGVSDRTGEKRRHPLDDREAMPYYVF